MARHYLHAVKIEAVGNATKLTNDGIFRWCYSPSFLDNLATVDPDDLYKTGLLFWPEELSASIDFRDGRATSAAQKYVLRADKAGVLWGELMRFRHSEVAELIADMTATQTTIDATTSGLDGSYFLEREAIKITGASQATITGGFRYTCARAKIGTTGRAHLSGGLDDKYLYGTPHVLAGRLVQLIRIDLDASTAYDEEILWSGILRNITSPDGGLSIELHVDSILQLVADSLIFHDRFEGRVFVAEDFAGQLAIFHVGPNVVPAGGANLTTDRQALFRVGDHLVKGEYITNVSDPELSDIFSLQIVVSPREVFAGRQIPEDLSSLANAVIREVFSTRSDSPSNATSPGDGTLPLSPHPGKLVLQLLTTTPNGNVAGPNGDYDTGCDVLAGDVDESLVDTAAILRWGDSVGVEFNDLYLGLEESPVVVGSLIESLLTPLLSVLVQTTEGKLTVVRLEDLAPYLTTATLVQSQILNVGISHDRNLIDSVDRVTISFGALPGLQPSKITGRDAIKYRRLPPGQHSSLELTVAGIKEQDVVSMLCTALVGRFHDPIPIVSVSCQATADFELGAVIRLTHDLIFAGDATRGASAISALVVSRRESMSDDTHLIDYQLLLVGLIHPRDGWIAPSAQVASAASASVFTVGANVFTLATSTDDDPFTTDVGGFAEGDIIDLLDQYGSIRSQTKTISDITGNVITLSSPFSSTPAATDIIRPTKYTASTTTQKDAWIYVASTSNILGASDLPKTYRT